MPFERYQQREAFYFHAVNSAQQVLSHPDIVAPEHPYLGWLSSMLAGAAMIVPDVKNGSLYAADTIVKNSVALLPLLESDIGKNKSVLCATTEAICTPPSRPVDVDIAKYFRTSSGSLSDYRLRLPMIILSPDLAKRSAIQVGVTIAHELDHAHRQMNPETFFWYGKHSLTSHAMMEIAAYRLEDALFRANDPEEYEHQRDNVRRRYKSFDFMRNIVLRDKDPYIRSVRGTAFINFMLDHFGAEVGTRPGRKLLKALQAQELIEV